MKINIINNEIYLDNIKLQKNDILKLKIFNTTKEIKVKNIIIKDGNAIVQPQNKTEYINLSKLKPNQIVDIDKLKNDGHKTLYLGGTCSGTNWRSFINTKNYNVYNPLKHNWNENSFLEEQDYRHVSTYNLYVFTKDISGYYAIASLIDDSHKYPEKTLLFIDETDMTQQTKISLKYVREIAKNNNIRIFNSYEEINNFLQS